MYSVHCTLYTVQCTVYTVHSIYMKSYILYEMYIRDRICSRDSILEISTHDIRCIRHTPYYVGHTMSDKYEPIYYTNNTTHTIRHTSAMIHPPHENTAVYLRHHTPAIIHPPSYTRYNTPAIIYHPSCTGSATE